MNDNKHLFLPKKTRVHLHEAAKGIAGTAIHVGVMGTHMERIIILVLVKAYNSLSRNLVE